MTPPEYLEVKCNSLVVDTLLYRVVQSCIQLTLTTVSKSIVFKRAIFVRQEKITFAKSYLFVKRFSWIPTLKCTDSPQRLFCKSHACHLTPNTAELLIASLLLLPAISTDVAMNPALSMTLPIRCLFCNPFTRAPENMAPHPQKKKAGSKSYCRDDHLSRVGTRHPNAPRLDTVDCNNDDSTHPCLDGCTQ